MGKSEDNRSYIVRGNWDPLARGFKELTHLNEETPKGIFVVVVFFLRFYANSQTITNVFSFSRFFQARVFF
jgi:hypothetical protein